MAALLVSVGLMVWVPYQREQSVIRKIERKQRMRRRVDARLVHLKGLNNQEYLSLRGT